MFSARLSGLFDNKIIDGMVDGLAASVRNIGRRLRPMQRGQMQQNLTFAFAVAAVLLLALFLFSNSLAR